MNEAVLSLTERKTKKIEAHERNKSERSMERDLAKTSNKGYANIRSVLKLSEMGFDKDLCALALKKTDNDLDKAVSKPQPSKFK